MVYAMGFKYHSIVSSGMVVKNSAQTITGNGTSHTINYPSGGSTGDRYILIGTASTGPTWTVPTGWTAISSVTGPSVISMERIQDGTEGSTFTFTSSVSVFFSCIVILVSGTDTTVAAQLSTTASSGTATTATPITISPAWGTAKNTLALVYYGLTTSGSKPTVFSSGYTAWQDDGTNNQQGALSVSGCAGIVNASSISPGAWTFNQSTAFAGRTIAIKGLV